MADMMNKTVLFLAVNGFDAVSFYRLWHCFGELNASIRIAGFDASTEILSRDGLVRTHSDMSFNNATQGIFDVIVISDGITARALQEVDDVQAILYDAFDRNAAIVTIDAGALVLIKNGLVKGLTIAAPYELRPDAEEAVVNLLNEPFLINNNIFTALRTADMQEICDSVSRYITTLETGEAA